MDWASIAGAQCIAPGKEGGGRRAGGVPIRRYDLPIRGEADAKAGKLPYRPAQDSPEMAYMHARRQGLGGYMPKRDVPKIELKAPKLESLREWTAGSKGRAVSTTMGVREHPAAPDEGPGDRQADCADCAR